MKIVTIPNKILRQTSKPVEKIDKKMINFISDLSNTLEEASDPPGIGLSAIQVGKPWQVFVTYLPKDQDLPMRKWLSRDLKIEVFIGPSYSFKSKEVTLGGSKGRPYLEGCMSMPGIYGPVWRSESIKLNYITLDKDNKPVEKTKDFWGFHARVIQHEYDHLLGKLFTDKSLEDELPVYEERDGEMVEISFS